MAPRTGAGVLSSSGGELSRDPEPATCRAELAPITGSHVQRLKLRLHRPHFEDGASFDVDLEVSHSLYLDTEWGPEYGRENGESWFVTPLPHRRFAVAN